MIKASSAMEPRATVCSTRGRSERPSAKKSLGASGLYLGWSAISCRQPPNSAAAPAKAAQSAIFLHEALFIIDLGNVLRLQLLKKLHRLRQAEFRILCFDADEKAVVRSMFEEALRIKKGVVRLGKPVQGQHAQHGENRSEKDGHFKSDGNERGPAV